MRWIKDELVEIDTLTSAMPCVALSNAATAYWKQANLRKIKDSLASLTPDGPEHKERTLLAQELAEAIGQLLMIPERNPEAHPLVPYYLALQARTAGDNERQKKYALLAYGRNPGNIDCVDLVAKIYEEAGNYKSAAPVLRKACEIAPENYGLRYRLGTALWTTGRKTEAQAEFTRALESGKILGVDKAVILVCMGRGQEALPEFVKMADSEKEQSSDKTYGLAGLVYLVTGHFGAGDKETALSFFEQLALAAPGVTEPANIRNANLHPLHTETLLTVLELYNAKHPTPPSASPE
jgi:tetratricopeptide (TPR) repeat protein